MAGSHRSVAGYVLEYHGAGNRAVLLDTPLTLLSQNSFEPKAIIIFPNPTSGIVKIALNNKIVDAIKIYDFQGKLIENKNFEIPLSNYYQFDFSKKEKGIYFMELITNGKSSWEKIFFE